MKKVKNRRKRRRKPNPLDARSAGGAETTEETTEMTVTATGPGDRRTIPGAGVGAGGVITLPMIPANDAAVVVDVARGMHLRALPLDGMSTA